MYYYGLGKVPDLFLKRWGQEVRTRQAFLIPIQTTSKHLFMFLSVCHNVSHVNSYTCCCLNCQQSGKVELIKEN